MNSFFRCQVQDARKLFLGASCKAAAKPSQERSGTFAYNQTTFTKKCFFAPANSPVTARRIMG